MSEKGIWRTRSNRCPATEYRMHTYRNSRVRSLVQCSLERGHDGEHLQNRTVFGVRNV